ncbi:EH signature domain-containing protein [Mailhella massiliensis]|uniref:EH signature domain-containing protein n=1 Tax=Mailhella massiliensis TaxID=1903261 RepID=UPI00097E0EE7|nr:EH signature domain-containing protein [Mailhella massiliensis]
MTDRKDCLEELASHLNEFIHSIPKYDEEKLRAFYTKKEHILERYAQKLGKGSAGFKKRKQELETAIRYKKPLPPVMTSSRYIRPLLVLWQERDYIRSCPPDHILQKHMTVLIHNTKKQCLGTLALYELCQVFIRKYQSLNENKKTFGLFVQQQLILRSGNMLSRIATLSKHRKELFSSSAHIWLGEEALQRSISLADMADMLGIQNDTELYIAAQNIFYIHKLKSLAPNQADMVLSEIRERKVYTAEYDEKKQLGHIALEIMIDKLAEAGQEPCQLWKDTIVHIAGDPRVPETHMDYRLWWSILGHRRVELMRGWLSRFDMHLFLRIIGEFAKTDDTMSRMFPERKKLLEHIFNKNHVSLTRLFLGTQPERFVNEWFGDKEKPFYTRLNDSKLTVFYYKVGNTHVIEGSHSFAMRILDKIPVSSAINNYEKMINIDELRKTLEYKYNKEFGSGGGYVSFRHSGNWKMIVIKELQKRGIIIHEDQILSKYEYMSYHL